MLNDEERLTLNEWLLRTNELGYFIAKPRIRYEAKGWKAVAEGIGFMVCIGLLLGGIMGGTILIGGVSHNKFFSCEKLK